jgi:hypothetical protein
MKFDHVQQLTPLCSGVQKSPIMNHEIIMHKFELFYLQVNPNIYFRRIIYVVACDAFK